MWQAFSLESYRETEVRYIYCEESLFIRAYQLNYVLIGEDNEG